MHRPENCEHNVQHFPVGANKRRYLLLRFVLLFGGLVFLFAAGLAVVFLLIYGFPLEPRRMPMPMPMHEPGPLACLTPLAFILLAGLLGRLFYSRFVPSLANLMDAADAVAKGDLTVRVPENIRGEFGRLAQRFNRMTAELQRAEQQRRNMTADIAHELRTPLHIIQGNLEGIIDGVYEPTLENIEGTLEETRLLARLVEDLQMLSLAEAGQLPMHPLRFSAADLLADVATSFTVQADEQAVGLVVECGAEPERLELYADSQRLDQVLSNLVDNALRHTPSGGSITLRAAALPGGVLLSVEDTGAGIAQEDLPYIFDRFWRGDRARSRAGGSGSGLGLAIARQLVAAQGGTIRVESPIPGGTKGTRFTIEMPRGFS